MLLDVLELQALARDRLAVEHVLHRVGVGDEAAWRRGSARRAPSPPGRPAPRRVARRAARPFACSTSTSGITPWSAVSTTSERPSPARRSTSSSRRPSVRSRRSRLSIMLLAVGAVGVADHVAGREADGQDVGGVVRAEVVGLHRGGREVEQDLVGERRAAQVVVVVDRRRRAADAVREDRVLAVPLALDVVLAGVGGRRSRGPAAGAPRRGRRSASGEPPRVPALEPARRLVRVPAAGDEAAARALVPVRRRRPACRPSGSPRGP